MRYDLPPLPALQAFEAAARHENFATAAAELNLSQSAVSHRVRLLERHLGTPLFERLPRGLSLTESAKAYLPSLRKAFDEILGSTSGIFGPRGEGFVTLRAPVSYTALWLAREIDAFQALYPEIEVRLMSSVWADKLAADETDIDLRLGYGHWPGFVAELLLRDPVLPVCSPAAQAAGPAIAAIGDLARHPLIHVMGTEDLWRQFFALEGLPLAAKLADIRVDSSIAAAEMAAAGSRITLLQKRFLTPYLEARRLVVALDQEMEIDQGLYLLRPEKSAPMKPEALLLRDWLIATFGEG
jgi:LysR family glycine cleavage system transcriptional activator